MDFDVQFVLNTPEEFDPNTYYSGWILPDGPIVAASWIHRHRDIATAFLDPDNPLPYNANSQLIGDGWVRWVILGQDKDSILLDGRTDDLNRPFIREAAGFLADQMGLTTARIDTRNTIGDVITDHHTLPIGQYTKYGIPTYRSPMQEFRTTGGPSMDFDVQFVLNTPEEFDPNNYYSGWILPDGPIVAASWVNEHDHIAYAAAELLDIPLEYATNEDIPAQLIGEGWVRWYSGGAKNDTILLDGRTDDLNRPFIREAVGFLADQMGLATAKIDTRNTIGDMVTDHHVLPINQYVKYGVPTYRSPMQEFRTTGSISDPFPGPKTQLEGTERQVVPVHEWTRFQQPCDPPENTAWPTPANGIETSDLLDRLPLKQRTICALIAVELVLPIYEEVEADRSPRETVEITYRWLEGQASVENVIETSDHALEIAVQYAHASQTSNNDMDRAVSNVADAAYTAADALIPGREAVYTSSYAVSTAALAAEQAGWMSSEEFLELWWKECRCRLVFTDVEGAELTTGSLYRGPFPNPKTQLEGTEQQVLPVHEWTRFQQPCDPPDDPRWPAPENFDEVWNLLDRLSLQQQVICALTAAELVLPIFEEFQPGIEAPKNGIAMGWQWVQGMVDREQVMVAATAAEDAGGNIQWEGERGKNAGHSAFSAAWAAESAGDPLESVVDDAWGTSEAMLAARGAWNMPEEEFYELWWKECRCRLAIADAPTAELLTTGSSPTRTVAQPPYYAPLKEYLEAPPATVLPQHSYARHLTPCDPPDDPNWPAPQTYEELLNLADRLSPRQQVRCMLVAAEFVLPIFEQEYPDDSRPREALGAIRRWLDGQGTIAAVGQAAERTDYALSEDALAAANLARMAARAAVIYTAHMVGYPQYSVYASSTTEIFHYASSAVVEAGWMSNEEFYAWWWRECRCRLAFMNAERAELTTGSIRSDTFPGPETQLEGTERLVVPVHDWARLQQPCDPPEDPAWPTPTDSYSIYNLLVRLPEKQQIICVLTAAEMVLPVFEEEYHDDDSPRRAVGTTYRWLNGEANLEAVRDAATIAQETVFETVEAAHVAADLEDAAAEASAAKAADASYAAAYAVSFAVGIEAVVHLGGDPLPDVADLASFEVIEEGITAVEYAAQAWWTTQREFYELWWKECRCRLALKDVEEAELLTTGNVYFEQPIERRPRT